MTLCDSVADADPCRCSCVPLLTVQHVTALLQEHSTVRTCLKYCCAVLLAAPCLLHTSVELQLS